MDGRSIADLSVIEKSFVEEVRKIMKFSGISQAFYLENGAILAAGLLLVQELCDAEAFSALTANNNR